MILEKHQEQLSDVNITENFQHSKSINHDNSLPADTKRIKKNISALFYSFMFRDMSKYKELFTAYEDEISTDKFKRKIMFKLEKVIKKLIDLGGNKIFIVPGRKVTALGNQSYFLTLTIYLINNKNNIETYWQQEFVYFNYLQGRSYFKDVDFLEEAQKFILSINKSMFNHQNWKSSKELFWFIKGSLEEISGDFKVTSRWNNLDLDLKNIDFQIHVYWKTEWVFDATIGWDYSFVAPKNKSDKKESNQKIPNDLKVTYDQGSGYAWNLLQEIQINYYGFWSSEDTIGEVIKTVKYLLHKKYGEIAKYISISTNKSPKTKLKATLENGVPDFDWIITFYGYNSIVWKNKELGFIKVENYNMSIEIPPLISQIAITNSFPSNGAYLKALIEWELSKLSYLFETTSKYANLHKDLSKSNFYLLVYHNGNWICDINLYLSYLGKNWVFKFFNGEDDKKIPVKDEL